MRVLVACEYSGTVRDAFIKQGHDAISCDLLPTDAPGPHFQGPVQELLERERFDLMIAHPPCTYLTSAGTAYFNEIKFGDKARERKRLRLEAFDFVKMLLDLPIEKICVENPVGFLNKNLRRPDQIIQPWYFGDREQKTTCLWLKGLPPLIHAKEDELFYKKSHVEKPEADYVHVRKGGQNKAGSIKKRYFTDAQHLKNKRGEPVWKYRSRTFQGIANAMASQWGQKQGGERG